MDTRLAAIFVLVGNGLCGLIGIHSRALNDDGFTYEQITFYRLLITAAAIGLFLALREPRSFRIRKEHILMFILLAFCKAGLDITFLISQRYIPLAFTTTLQMTAPFWVMAMCLLFFGERPTRKGIFATVICIIGTVFVSGIITDNVTIDGIGVVMGISSGILLAGYFLATESLFKKGYGTSTVLFYAFFVGTILMIPLTDIPESVELIATVDLAVANILILAVVCTIIPFVGMAVGVKYLSPFTTSILCTFEVVTSALVGFAFFGEFLSPLDIVGVVLVIASIVIMAKSKIDAGEGDKKCQSDGA